MALITPAARARRCYVLLLFLQGGGVFSAIRTPKDLTGLRAEHRCYVNKNDKGEKSPSGIMTNMKNLDRFRTKQESERGNQTGGEGAAGGAAVVSLMTLPGQEQHARLQAQHCPFSFLQLRLRTLVAANFRR